MEEVNFFIDSNTTASSIVAQQHSKTRVTKTVTLASLIEQYHLTSFFLVCDIEGAEAEFLWHDFRAFDRCTGMIIELHRTYMDNIEKSIDDMIQRCTTYLGFYLKERDGNVFYFVKQ